LWGIGGSSVMARGGWTGLGGCAAPESRRWNKERLCRAQAERQLVGGERVHRDEAALRRLEVNLTSDPDFATKQLFIA
jgi:hypothetical protein